MCYLVGLLGNLHIYKYVAIYCSFIFSPCIFIFYFSSEILAKFSYSVNPRLNKVYVCMHVCMYHHSMYVCIFAALSLNCNCKN